MRTPNLPRFVVTRERTGNLHEYHVQREGADELECVIHDADLARAIESHAEVCAALEAALPLIDGLTNAHTKAQARAALARARGES